jgi:hypothetical protein
VCRREFGFNTWESVKMFIWGLGRLDLCHLLLARPGEQISIEFINSRLGKSAYIVSELL